MCLKKDYLGSKVDIWAAGILFFTILIGYQPFKASSEKELFKKIIKGQLVWPKDNLKLIEN
jgi:serine/threonine protein kinase